MTDEIFQILEVSDAQRSLSALHEHVAARCGRVQIVRPGSGDSCVLISKGELDALEHALEILSDGDSFRILCTGISQIAATTDTRVGPPSPVAGDGVAPA